MQNATLETSNLANNNSWSQMCENVTRFRVNWANATRKNKYQQIAPYLLEPSFECSLISLDTVWSHTVNTSPEDLLKCVPNARREAKTNNNDF